MIIKELHEKLKELESLLGNSDAESEARMDEIAKWLHDHKTPQTEPIITKWMDDWVAEMEVDIEDLKKEIGSAQLLLN